MTTITEAALAASVILGLVSIPAVSETGTPTGAFSGSLPNVSSTDSMPREVSISTSPDGFRRTVETAFDEFRTIVVSQSTNITLENPGSRLEVQRTPSRTIWTLTTASGTLKLSKSGDARLEEVSTPSGTLRRIESHGVVTEDFEGSDRAAVEDSREKLRELMEDRKQEVERRSARMQMEQYEGSISLNVSSGASGKEYAVITNEMESTLDVEGWTITDTVSSHEFDDVTVPPGGRLYAYTETEVEPTDEGAVNVYGTGIAWNDGGDTAILRHTKGQEVARYEY